MDTAHAQYGTWHTEDARHAPGAILAIVLANLALGLALYMVASLFR